MVSPAFTYITSSDLVHPAIYHTRPHHPGAQVTETRKNGSKTKGDVSIELVLYSSIQCCTVLYSAVQFYTVMYSSIQCCKVLYSAVQFYTVQCSVLVYYMVHVVRVAEKKERGV